ncbi:MAG: hypothetical protein QOI74_1782 [Micromonosporaceae bacterium]|nr:hypothetical protein [Micromonosporaceae bacterium]
MRALRRYVARSVIIVYFFLVVTIGLTVLGRDGTVVRDGVPPVIWAIAFVPLTGGFAAAVRVLGVADRGRSPRLAMWAVGLLLLGVALLVVSSVTGL